MKITIGALILSLGTVVSTASMAKPICEQYQEFYLSLPSDESKYDKEYIVSKYVKKYSDIDESVLYGLSLAHDNIVECDSHWYCEVYLTHTGQAKFFKKQCEEGTLKEYLDI